MREKKGTINKVKKGKMDKKAECKVVGERDMKQTQMKAE